MTIKGATLGVSGAPPYQPHPRDASGADCVRAFLFDGFAASFEFKISYRVAVTIKFSVKFKILWYLALYFAKYL